MLGQVKHRVGGKSHILVISRAKVWEAASILRPIFSGGNGERCPRRFYYL